VADKFGDVYSLPLIPLEPKSGGSEARACTPAAQNHRTLGSGANTLTVHSGRNRMALEMQLAVKRVVPKAEGPTFEHSLLLGHVSMLTALVIAHQGERTYLITADRDEHIRVSRSIPQTHIIENFCLGHTEFISSLTIPPSRPDILVSGGGDRDLFFWDWQLGKLVAKTDLFDHVQQLSEATAKIAVSRLYSASTQQMGGGADCVFALCEG
jgi:tRNA (guanine-N(7)-)-methyltransferase subunit TRM82